MGCAATAARLVAPCDGLRQYANDLRFVGRAARGDTARALLVPFGRVIDGIDGVWGRAAFCTLPPVDLVHGSFSEWLTVARALARFLVATADPEYGRHVLLGLAWRYPAACNGAPPEERATLLHLDLRRRRQTLYDPFAEIHVDERFRDRLLADNAPLLPNGRHWRPPPPPICPASPSKQTSPSASSLSSDGLTDSSSATDDHNSPSSHAPGASACARVAAACRRFQIFDIHAVARGLPQEGGNDERWYAALATAESETQRARLLALCGPLPGAPRRCAVRGACPQLAGSPGGSVYCPEHGMQLLVRRRCVIRKPTKLVPFAVVPVAGANWVGERA